MNYEKIIKSIRYNGLLDSPDDTIYNKARKAMDKAKYMQNKVYLASMPYKPTAEQLQTIHNAIKSAENQKYAIIDKPLPVINRALQPDRYDRENQKILKINNRLIVLRDMKIGKIPFDMKFINPFA